MPSFPSLQAPPNTTVIGQTNGLTHLAFTVTSGQLAPSTGISNLVAGPCEVFGGALGNVTGGAAFLKLYDLAANTALSGVPADAVFVIPGNAAGAGANFTINGLPNNAGMQFFNGLNALVTANPALADASAVSGGVVVTLWVR